MFKDRLSLPVLPDKDDFDRLITDLSSSLILSNDGPYSKLLERRLIGIVGGQFCVLFSSASAAIDVLLYLLKDRSITTCPYTWVTSLSPLFRYKRGPVSFVDLNVETFQAITTAGVATDLTYFTHVYGIPNLEHLQDRCSSTAVFDGSHALGVVTSDGNGIASHGLATVFSLHATKGFTGGEGGAIVTNDENLFEVLTGISRPTKTNNLFDIRCFNARMSELSAGMAWYSLSKIDEVVKKRQKIWQTYRNAFGSVLVNLETEHVQRSNYLYAIIRPDRPATTAEIQRKLSAKSIASRQYFGQVICESDPDLYPNAKKLSETAIAIPLHHMLSEEDVGQIIDLVMTAIDQ